MQITNTHKGILFLVAGGLLLLNTFGFIGQTLNLLVAICAVLMLILGFILLDGHIYVRRYAEKLNRKK